MDTTAPTGASETHDRKVIHDSINAEPQETTERKLTGRQILENAGFTPRSTALPATTAARRSVSMTRSQSMRARLSRPPSGASPRSPRAAA